MESNRKTVVMAEVIPPERANFTGHVHGGYIMLLADRVAYACAARYSGKNVVTVSIDEIAFKEPIFIGELVTFHSSVNYVGKSSMEIGIRITAEDLKAGKVRHTNSCYITMVAIDESGRPTQVDPLILESDTERRRYREAEIRKKLRQEMRFKFAEQKKQDER